MSLFGLFKSPAKIRREDVGDIKKVTALVEWFATNDEFVKAIANPSCTIIYREGIRPMSGEVNDPEQAGQIDEFVEWFIWKIFIDLNILKDLQKEPFEKFLDGLEQESGESIVAFGDYFIKYDIDPSNFVYERDLNKIPEVEREWFKTLLLDDTVLSCETRIVAWVYHEFFGEWYKVKYKS